MKILVFFKAGGLSRIRTSTYNHIFFLKQHIEDKVEIIYWDIIVPVPQIVKKTKLTLI